MNKVIGPKEKIVRKYLSSHVINFLKKTSIRAEYITTTRIILEIISALMLSIGTYSYYLTAIIIFQFASFMDSVDGAIARYRKNYSQNWVIIDGVFHHIVSSLLLLSLGIGVFRSTNQAVFLFLGFVGAFTLNLSQLIQAEISQFKKLKDTKTKKKGIIMNKAYLLFWDFIRLEQPFSILFFAVIFNVPSFGLLFYCLINSLNLLLRIFETIFLIKK